LIKSGFFLDDFNSFQVQMNILENAQEYSLKKTYLLIFWYFITIRFKYA